MRDAFANIQVLGDRPHVVRNCKQKLVGMKKQGHVQEVIKAE
jgi:hypothetical protein